MNEDGTEKPRVRASVSPDARQHILGGDRAGGGHRAGAGRSIETQRLRRRLTTALNHLMAGLCASWSDDERFHATEYIENYEFALALELLSAVVVENSKPLTAGQLGEIDALASAMNLSGSEYLRDLHAYAARLGLQRSGRADNLGQG